MEQLSSELKQLKLQRKIDKPKKKLKDYKSHEVASSSSSNKEIDASSEEEVKDKKGEKGDKRSTTPTTLLPFVMIIYLTKIKSEVNLQHWVSFYADDMVLFLHPTSEDISLIMDILHIFGEASGLRNNLQKSCVFPIRCSDEERNLVQQLLPCQVSDFPCWYLGLPFSLKKLTRDQLQPCIDKIAYQLPGWKAYLLTRPGRKILVQFVVTGMMIYLAMAVDIHTWGLKAVDKIRWGFY
jgi:hypothetical protein